jgi:GNAT superfamily N-acetyltransferase
MQIDPGPVSLSPSVRRAVRADAAELAQLVNRAYQVESFFVEGARTDEDEIVRLAQSGHFLVLDRHGGAGGIAAAVYVRIEGARGFFGMLSVAPDAQGLGLGRRLVAVAEALCQAMGCTEMGLEVVNLREELTPWYRRLGYREVGTSPYNPPRRVPTRDCHFIHMEKSLPF